MDIEELKKIKKEKKLTLADISNLSGIPKRTVDDIFSGKTQNPRIDTMQAIEKALGINNNPIESSPKIKKINELLSQIEEKELNNIFELIRIYLSK